MITVTDTATEKLKEILDDEGQPEAALRVIVVPQGGGAQYMLALEDGLADDDLMQRAGFSAKACALGNPIVTFRNVSALCCACKLPLARSGPISGNGLKNSPWYKNSPPPLFSTDLRSEI